LLEQATRRYPNVALLASNYRQFRGEMREPEPAPDYGPSDEFEDQVEEEE